ncbi:hypothetical protein BGZ76_008477 [Entomortierella beljakovae]|nr:hypothetical protein BGZ76_008477 [Entomortierella beljakovae]
MNPNFLDSIDGDESEWSTEYSDEDGETIPSNDENDEEDEEEDSYDDDDDDIDIDIDDDDDDDDSSSDDSLEMLPNPFQEGLFALNNALNGTFFELHMDHVLPFWNVEALTESNRANFRPNTDDDVMSEFSGDEKYEIDRATFDGPGDGDQDMIDINTQEARFMATPDTYLTYKIRQLMLRLSKGRKDRENRLHIKSESTYNSNDPYLHQLIVRGSDHPQELEHSPAVTFHHQCANSLCVTPSAMGLWDDIFTVNSSAIMRCGVLDKTNPELYGLRRRAAWNVTANTSGGASRVHDACAQKLKTVKATKFLDISSYKFDRLPREEFYIPFEQDEHPLCLAHKYGFLAMGAANSRLVVYCTQCDGTPRIVYDDRVSSSMLNSVQIVRWPRYNRNKGKGDDDVDEDMNEQDSEEEDAENGYPSESGSYDHCLIMTGNGRGLFIAALPDHPKNSRKHHSHAHHKYKFDKDRTWIRSGFERALLNDARASPDGRWIAVVGDSPKVWVIEVSHTLDPITQMEEKSKTQMEEKPTTHETWDSDDSDYITEDSEVEYDDPAEVMDGRKRSKGEACNQSQKAHRLYHRFGKPFEMIIPSEVLQVAKLKRNRGRVTERNRYYSQYVAWNSTSTKFAHTSDVSPRVIVWSVPSREIVCCVDVGGPSYSISFHPTLENLFSVCNWYGFVHVMDITECCKGNEDTHPMSRTVNESKIPTCFGPHFEEKHDILMLSFRGETNTRLRILDCIRGMGWSTDGRHLYVATLRRVLRYELKDNDIRIPSLFQQCARKVREWKERELNQVFTEESTDSIKKEYQQMEKDWKYVPYSIKRKIFGDNVMLRTHN